MKFLVNQRKNGRAINKTVGILLSKKSRNTQDVLRVIGQRNYDHPFSLMEICSKILGAPDSITF